MGSPVADLLGIPLGRQHHADRGVGARSGVRPAGSCPSAAPTSQGTRSSSQPQQHRLGLGIPEAAVPLDHLGTLGRQHEPAVEQPAEGPLRGGQRPHGGQEDRLDDARAQLLVDQRRGRVGAHAAGVGTPVAVVGRLVVLGRGQQGDALAVAEGHHRHLGAEQPLLDDHPGAGLTEPTGPQHGPDRLARLLVRRGHHHPLARAEPVGLDHDVAPLRVDEGLGRRRPR